MHSVIRTGLKVLENSKTGNKQALERRGEHTHTHSLCLRLSLTNQLCECLPPAGKLVCWYHMVRGHPASCSKCLNILILLDTVSVM